MAMVVRQCAIPRLDAELSQSVAALVGQEVLIAVPVDIARADQRLELFWRQLLAGGLPLQLSNDLVHAASIMNVLGIAVTGQAALPRIFPVCQIASNPFRLQGRRRFTARMFRVDGAETAARSPT